MDNLFFKPTPLYKEFMILDMIEKDTKITQRKISDELGISVSMVNSYLESYENKGYIKRKYISAKVVEYNITHKGIEQKKFLNITYLKSSYNLYEKSIYNLIGYLKEIEYIGCYNLVLYGAGEVAEMLIFALNNSKELKLKFLAIVDDDVLKIDKYISNLKIIKNSEIKNYKYDAILISSYNKRNIIKNKLINLGINNDRIINFFNF